MSLNHGTEPGALAPTFRLPNANASVGDSEIDLESVLKGAGGIVMFTCNHCPYVIHYHDEIIRLEKDYAKNINIVAISSNDIISHPQDDPLRMKEMWNSLGLSFPYLFDETQEIARKYKAECTPEFYLFDSNQKLVYRGRMDESSPGSDQVPTGNDLRSAIDNLQNNKPISEEQLPSMGCNIKWKI